MNTISTTASTSTILAIDLGKYKCVACVLDEATGEVRFTTFETTRTDRGTCENRSGGNITTSEARGRGR
jgi:hypothetical protein